MGSSTIERVGVETMIEVVTTTLANARRQGEPWKSKAEEHLGGIEEMLAAIQGERATVLSAIAAGEAALGALDERSGEALAAMADDVWHLLDRPALDPVFALLFSDTDRTAGKIEERPEFLETLALLVESCLPRRIDAARVKAAASELRAMAQEYRLSVETLVRLRQRRTVLDSFERAAAQSGLVEAGNLRKSLREMGIDENTIFEIAPGVHSVRGVPKSTR